MIPVLPPKVDPNPVIRKVDVKGCSSCTWDHEGAEVRSTSGEEYFNCPMTKQKVFVIDV